MLELFKAFSAIATRRLGPEDLPASAFLLVVTVALYLALQVPVSVIVFGPTADALRTVLADTVLMVAGLWLLLWLTGHAARYQQTLTAVFGTGALLSLLSIPFNLWQSALGDATAFAAAPRAAILGIVLWSFVINGHILARALSKPFFVGLMIAIAFFILHTATLFSIVPVPG